MTRSLLQALEARSLIAQVSDREKLAAHLDGASRTVYAGFDPTADSLHIGNLVPLLTLRRFQGAGHRPIALVGGATGLIGDPSGKTNERSLNTRDVVAAWVERIRAQVSRFIDFEGNNAALVVDNLDWTANLDVITFLRDIGKHFSVNAMMQKESVRARLTAADKGISFTEFSYMILQSMDYVELARRYHCSVQVGGNDQWGNITAGMDLVRRTLAREAFALTVPLVTKADGTKFGKTEAGSVWLDPRRTSPYAFYQFWLNTADADVERFLMIFSLLEVEEIAALAGELATAPQARLAQRRLAEEVTRLTHGEAGLKSAQRITEALFGSGLSALTEADLEQLAQDGLPVTTIGPAGCGLITFLADANLAQSRGAARKLVASHGVSVNGEAITDEAFELTRQDALYGKYQVIRRGKKVWHLGVHATN
jgi:tyrosyl-tRNA synthetase